MKSRPPYSKTAKNQVWGLFFALMMSFAVPLHASGESGKVEDTGEKKDATTSATPIERYQEKISHGVVSSAKWVDSFFKDENYEVEQNTTHLWIRLDAFMEERETPKFNFSPILKLVLPYTERKLRLEIITSSNDDLDIYEGKPSFDSTEFNETSQQPTSATLRYFIMAKDKLNLSVAAGAYYDDNEPHFYIGPRSRVSFGYGLWEIRFIEWLRWITYIGLDSKTQIDFDRLLTERFLFRTRLEGDWSDDDDEFINSVSFLLYQQLSEKRVVAYEYKNSMTNRPGYRLEEILLKITYRQRIWRDWLFAEIAPQMSFPRDRDFYHTPGILFRIEIYFGLE